MVKLIREIESANNATEDEKCSIEIEVRKQKEWGNIKTCIIKLVYFFQ